MIFLNIVISLEMTCLSFLEPLVEAKMCFTVLILVIRKNIVASPLRKKFI